MAAGESLRCKILGGKQWGAACLQVVGEGEEREVMLGASCRDLSLLTLVNKQQCSVRNGQVLCLLLLGMGLCQGSREGWGGQGQLLPG